MKRLVRNYVPLRGAKVKRIAAIAARRVRTPLPPDKPHQAPGRWVIRRTFPDQEGDALYWSNSLGWVDRDSADQFALAEKNGLNLPLQGEWVPYDNNPQAEVRQ